MASRRHTATASSTPRMFHLARLLHVHVIAAFVVVVLPRPVAGRGGESTMDDWVCLRPYLPEPVIRPRANATYTSPHHHHVEHPPAGEPRNVWEGEVWAAEAAARAEASHAGSGGSHWGSGGRAEYPRLSYARELGLPSPMQFIIVGGTTWNPRPNADDHDPEQPIPMLAFDGEDPEVFAAAYAHYHGHGTCLPLPDENAFSTYLGQLTPHIGYSSWTVSSAYINCTASSPSCV